MSPGWIAAIICVALILAQPYYGCKKDEGPTNVDTTDGNNIPDYGRGSLSFNTIGGGSAFSAQGPYVPSEIFLSDTNSGQGAGGFLADTTLYRKRIKAMLAGYDHRVRGPISGQRLIVFMLNNSSGPVSVGEYRFVSFDATPTPSGKYAYIYFNSTDSAFVNSIFEADTGLLSITDLDTASQRVRGTFSGVLKNLSDTSRISISGGQLHIEYVGRYFNF